VVSNGNGNGATFAWR
jgi:hypothetical protein